MRYREMETLAYLGLGPLGPDVSLVELGNSFTKAERFITMVLPAEAIPEMTKRLYLDPDESIYDVTLPARFLQLIACSFGITRDSGAPDYKLARIVDQAEWQARRGKTRQRLANVTGAKLNLSPFPAAASAGNPPSVEATFKFSPMPYMSLRVARQAALVTVTKHANNNYMFAFPENEDWDDYGLDDENLVGGEIEFVWSGVKYAMKITQTAVESTYSYVVVDPDGIHPTITSSVTAIISEVGIYGSSLYLEKPTDHESPELRDSFHNMIVDYAVADVMIARNVPGGVTRMNRVYSELNALGASIQYIKEARKDEADGQDS